MKGNRINFFIVAIVTFLFITSCKQIDLHEQNTTIPKNKWQSDFLSKSTFDIKDTNCIYNVYIVLRHKDAYDYSNIWLNVGFQKAGEVTKFRKFNLTLSNDSKGWEGVGMNDIWEVRKLIARERLKKGTYNISVAHIMRQNPLQHIMNVGVRVEKDTK